MWNAFLPISMPITVIALSSFRDMASCFAFDGPCQFGFMAGLDHGPDHPILGHYRIAAIALHWYREALQLSWIMLGIAVSGECRRKAVKLCHNGYSRCAFFSMKLRTLCLQLCGLMGLSLIAVLRRHNVTICRISAIVQVFTARH